MPRRTNNATTSLKTPPGVGISELLAGRRKRCDCQLCKTGRKYQRIISKLPPKEREWMDGFYNAAFEESAELEMIKAS